MSTILFILFFVAFVGVIGYGFIRRSKQRKAMAAWAVKNGWQPLQLSDGVLEGYLPDYLQGAGDSRGYDMAYSGTYKNAPLVLFQYNYTVRSQDSDGRDTSTTYYYAVVSTTVKQTWPKLLLMHHSFLSKITGFLNHLGLQPLSLEGNFNDHFDCYITKDTQIQALSLLTPDTMQIIQDNFPKASLQVNGQQVTMSLETNKFSPEYVTTLLNHMAALVNEINAKPLAEAKA